MADGLALSLRTLEVGGAQKPFPKLVAAKTMAIKDIIANKIVEYVSIRSKSKPPALEEIDKEFDGKISALEEEHAFSTDETQKAGLSVKIHNLKREKMFKKSDIQDAADKLVEDELFAFLKNILLENAVKVTSIALGSFDESGNLVPMDERILASTIDNENLVTSIQYILDDLVATKKKLNGMGEKFGELLNGVV